MNTTIQTIFGAPDDIRSLDYGGISIKIMIIGIQTILVFLGTFIQIKIITTCLNEKNTTCWKLDITHAIGLMIWILFSIIFETMTDQLPELHKYSGVWMCYIAVFVYSYLAFLIVFHTFIVAFMKYIFIVHQPKVHQFGEEKIKKIFFLFNLVQPFILAILTTLTYDFESNASLIRCFGLQEELLARYNTSTGTIEKVFLCKLGRWGYNNEDIPLFYIKQGLCVAKAIWVLVFGTNMPEAYFYLKIFSKMRR